MPGSRQEPRADQTIERCRNPLAIVTKTGDKLFAGQKGARVPMEEQQQVEIAAMADRPNAAEPRAQVWCVDMSPLSVG